MHRMTISVLKLRSEGELNVFIILKCLVHREEQDVLSCSKCFRSVGLWLYKRDQDPEHSDDELLESEGNDSINNESYENLSFLHTSLSISNRWVKKYFYLKTGMLVYGQIWLIRSGYSWKQISAFKFHFLVGFYFKIGFHVKQNNNNV